MTIRDLIVTVRVADPQISPNGQTVAFVRTTTDPATGKRNADIWVVPADGSARRSRSLPATRARPRRAGRRMAGSMAFISTRDGDPQMYLADADGSNVRKVTDVSGGVQPPLVFSPDGTMVAFVADVYPECRTTRATGSGARPRTRTGQGARDHAAVVSALGRVARERASPRVHRAGRGPGRRPRCHARRLRLAARPAGGRRDRVRARQQDCWPSSRIARATTRKRGRRTTTCGRCR